MLCLNKKNIKEAMNEMKEEKTRDFIGNLRY